MGTVDPNSSNRESRKQDDAEPGCRLISLLSFLEPENVRLRQAIVQLSLDARAIRETLNKIPGRDRFCRLPGPVKNRSRFGRVRKRGPSQPFEP
jgi:hypothetical protein